MTILFLSSHTQSLFWFRLDLMICLVNKGHHVIAIGPESELDWSEKFNIHKIQYKCIYIDRNGINPIKDFKTFIALFIILREIKPDKLFIYQAKTIVYGSFSALFNKISDIYILLGGLGSVFRGDGIKNKILSIIIGIQYKIAFIICRKVIFQNNDDISKMISLGLIDKSKISIINGSGVNMDLFKPTILPMQPSFLFIGRIIRDKGVNEYLEACRILKEKYKYVAFHLVGPFDTNPTALKYKDIERYIQSKVIEYHGEQKDVKKFISLCTTFVLPSYHEGTPKTVLEAMAMGRAIITSNAPGCKETVINGLNGYLVKVKSITELVEKMEFLIKNPDINQEMGFRSIEIVKEKYDVNKVNSDILKIMGIS